MSIHYNAFISYRHHPEDIKVATQIHRALERFHVPKAIRAKAKLPMRLFRDKDELPITSNLSDDIFEALQNSDYLIVICSVHTKESMWVQREIETFLQTHHRSKVLTVLVNGEPYDVIPDILLSEEITDPVTGEKKRVPVEPLSCDWRMGHRKAVREELPRLAAPLLHCSYDELRQRQRQYRMKRMVTFFSIALAASLCLSAYFLYTAITIRNANIQIQKNLEESLKNQSQHLATASQERMENNDRLTAIALALEALPSEENPRPYVANAEYALTEALGVYSQGSTLAATGAMIPNSVVTVTDFVTDDAAQAIYLLDSRDVITIWDPKTLKKTGTITMEEFFQGNMAVSLSANLLVIQNRDFQSVLQCFRPDGSMVWEVGNCSDFAFTDDKATLMALIWKDNQYSIRYLDPDTGKPIRAEQFLPDTSDITASFRFAQKNNSPNAPLALKYSSYPTTTLYVLDDTSKLLSLCSTEEALDTVTVLEDGRVLSMISDGSGMWNGNYSDYSTTSPARSVVMCHDSTDGTLLWESEITTYVYTSAFNILPIPESQRLLCQSGNTIQIMDANTGEILNKCESLTGVLTLEANETFAMAVLQDGGLLHYSYENNECTAYDFNLEGNLRQAYMKDGTFFTLQMQACQVTAYQYISAEHLWEDTSKDYVYVRRFRQHGDLMAIETSEQFYLYDLKEQCFRWEIDRNNSTLLVFSQDGSKVLIQDENYQPVLWDVATGECSMLDIKQPEDGTTYAFPYRPKFQENRAWSIELSSGQLQLCWVDVSTGDTDFHTFLEYADVDPDAAKIYQDTIAEFQNAPEADKAALEEDAYAQISIMVDAMYPLSNGASVIWASSQYAWIATGTGELYELDLTAGESRLVLDELEQTPVVESRESDGLTALAVENEILLKYPGEDIHVRITLDEDRAGSLRFHEDALLALCETGCIQRFDLEGNLLTRTELAVSSSFSSNLFFYLNEPTDISWTFTEDGKLILVAFDVANIIDCETWACRGYLIGCLSYYEAGNFFPCSGETGLCAYPCYETEELIQMGHDALGDFQLTPELKNSYGLN